MFLYRPRRSFVAIIIFYYKLGLITITISLAFVKEWKTWSFFTLNSMAYILIENVYYIVKCN